MTASRVAPLLGVLALVLATAGCGGGRPEPGSGSSGADAAGGAATAEGPRNGETPGATEPGAAAAAGGGEAGATEAGAAGGSAADADVAAGADAGEGGDAGALAAAGVNHREVVVFFQRADDDMLGPERRKILLTTSIADQARQIIGELAAGPETDDLLPTVPRGTEVRAIYLDRAGTAFVDLSEEFASLHPGGSSEELSTVLSVVDSLTYNLPEIKRVRFLIGGEERDTLRNHLDLRAAWLKDMSMVRMEDGG